MAATRLIPLHINKGKTVAQCLADRTDYSQNAAKTEDGKYISSYACDPRTCDEEFLLSKRQYEHITGKHQKHDVIAYQIRQSFRPGEITPEEANQIGYELVMRFTKGKHAFIVATHIDRAHIHNHIIFNSTTLDATRKFKDFFLSARAVARISDVLCLEHGLSIIVPKPYRERQKRSEYPKRETMRDSICRSIDEALKKQPRDFDALLNLLQEDGYEVKKGKHPAVKAKEQKRYVRFRSMGDGYSLEELSAVIAGSQKHNGKEKVSARSRQTHDSGRMKFLIDMQSKVLEGKGVGYERWAKVFNLKQMAQAMIFMQEQNIDNYQDLVKKTAAATDKCEYLLASIKADEQRLQEIAVLKTHIINYSKARDIFEAYRKSGYSKDFFEDHRDSLTLRKAAKQAFEEYKKENGDVPLPKVKDLSAEYAEVLARKKTMYQEYRKQKAEMKDFLVAKKITETLLGEEIQQEEPHRQEEKLI